MIDIHKEKYFEREIIEHLCSNGWIEGDNKGYDRELALYPEDCISWIKSAYPEEHKKLVESHGLRWEAYFLEKMTSALDLGSSLSVLRNGFKVPGLGSTRFAMAQFKPGSGLNDALLARYNSVICRVVSQVHYSKNNENSIDLVLFINGIPVATLELKTESTQTWQDAVDQYKTDRFPKDPKTNLLEPLLKFKSRCIVYFAVSTDEVWMTTRLDGFKTYFKPFNMGNGEASGNPLNPNGLKTAYLWEKVLERDAWLDIVGRFVHLDQSLHADPVTGKQTSKDLVIFPRYHQWDCVLELEKAAKTEGPGHHYLVQHSAGSGKSNSIAWLAHRLSSLHSADDKKIFDSVIVITDRNVLDKQLQNTIYQFDHKQGVVERITNDDGAKSTKLADALINKNPIIIVTIQTFSFLMDKINEKSFKDHNFAVIADEAHTSQTGSASASLKKALTSAGIGADEELSTEDLLVLEMVSRQRPKNVSFFAFTATPKAKTLELFGRPDETGVLHPFHSYSMRQAIEENYILDVLKSFISYKVAWRLASGGKEYDDADVEKSEALKTLGRWVRLHPYNISQKVKLIIEHFREHVAMRLKGEAKAMVVTDSREAAVRYKLAMDKYIKEQGYKLGALVAFSNDINVDGENYSERSMNTDLKGMDIREGFDGPNWQVLIVADKFQTGFDQPKLVALYVDKRLSGVATVQTFSRLNRVYPGKDFTSIIDFVNNPDEVLADFRQYYTTASLPETTDPGLLLTLQDKLDAVGIYTESEVEAFAKFYWDPSGKQTHMGLQKVIQAPIERFRERLSEARKAKDEKQIEELRLFVKDLGTYKHLYEFLSQIFEYNDSELEKRYVFFREIYTPLIHLLRQGTIPETVDLSGVKLTHYAIKNKGGGDLELENADGDSALDPIVEAGLGNVHNKEYVKFRDIIDKLNSLFEGELSNSDVINYAFGVRDKLMENKTLQMQAGASSLDQFSASPDLKNAVLDAVEEQKRVNSSLAEQIMENKNAQREFLQLIVKMAWEGFRNNNGTV